MNSNIVVGLVALLAVPAPLSAHGAKHRRHPSTGAPQGADGVDLATLAPVARRSTTEQTYGDAAIARSRVQRAEKGDAGVEDAAAGMLDPHPCEPRSAGPAGYQCEGEPPQKSYGLFYAYTPASVSAPQNVATDPYAQAPVLPAITSFFWAANSWRIDPHK